MGQQHQVYLAYTKHKVATPRGNYPVGWRQDTRVMGLAHCWMYGKLAVRQVVRIMRMVCNSEKRHPWSEQMQKTELQSRYDNDMEFEAFRWLLRMIPDKGYFAALHPMSELEVKDPRGSENDDGLTIFDFRDEDHPAYCFMSLWEGFQENPKIQPLVPLSAEDYLLSYYDVEGKWANYSREMGTKDEVIQKIIKRNNREVRGLLRAAGRFNVMTLDAVKEIFPAMFEDPDPRDSRYD
jgi:hypothetical protein